MATPSRPELFTRDSLFLGGEWVPKPDNPRIDIVNPADEEVIGSVPAAGPAEVDEAIRIAVEASRSNPWHELSFVERGEIIGRIGDELAARADDLAESYIFDQGGLRSFAGYIVPQAVGIFTEHRNIAKELPAEPVWREAGGERNLITYEPAGPLLAIVPWNAPIILAAVKIAPALLAGDPVVVKVAPENPSASYILAEAIAAAGVPAGMISFLPGRSSGMGNISARPEFAHVAFTGSTEAGVGIMKSAAENITGVTLELGGKSPGIFLEDIDPVDGARLVIPGSLGQSGQVCTTYSRLLVPESRQDEWTQTLSAVFSSLKVGDPAEEDTVIGPLASPSDRDRVERYLAIAREEGATILTGGQRPEGLDKGYYVEPTLVTDVTDDMRIVREEVFGPVITLQTYTDIDDAVRIANDTSFGLAAGIFTSDPEKAAATIAPQLEAGNISINNFGACLVIPFGGYKKSGLGREGGVENVYELMETKQIRMPMPAMPL
ncbi:aldehyde dehydrogenase family protein [Corynebacterium variabile]|uniref:aldehyde dehydrogenase family protein n=1 Tax=Corynebacterium variabile TaxID=1727 RepID=UPI0028B09725|nr:aldehyde dehydrogenase family protein [Corynebacterium variabile]